jgi:AraC-like DNA-binding protein
MSYIKFESPIVPARYFAILGDFLDSINVCSSSVLKEAGLDREKLNHANQTITPQQLELLLAAAQRAGGRTDMAFELGRRIKLNAHDILSCALISCATPGHLMQLLARYYMLINPMLTMSYQRNGDSAELVFRPALPMTPTVLQFWLEATAISTYLQIKDALPDAAGGFDIFVSMEAPAHFARYVELGEFAHAKFHFAPSPFPEICIRVVAAQLDMPLPMANAHAVSLAEARCQHLLSQVSRRKSSSEWVGMILQHAEDCQPRLEDLAKQLNVSPRTLDRHLNGEGTNFRALSVQIRNQRACKLIRDGKMTISQIAYTLGYTDLANFSRSFKKAHGVSPNAYRGKANGHAELN